MERWKGWEKKRERKMQVAVVITDGSLLMCYRGKNTKTTKCSLPSDLRLSAEREETKKERKAELIRQLSFIDFDRKLWGWQIDSPVQDDNKEMYMAADHRGINDRHHTFVCAYKCVCVCVGESIWMCLTQANGRADFKSCHTMLSRHDFGCV